MRALTIVFTILFALLMVSEAQAKSCSTFAGILSFDAGDSSVKLKILKGSESKFFPKPEGAPTTSKLPEGCKSRATKQASFPIKTTGGRMSVTQIRENFSGKMLNDTSDPKWLPAELAKLTKNKVKVLVVLRPPVGKKTPYELTTIYLPITPEEEAEIERLEKQSEDM
jgi:hypothetical protein